MSTPVGHRRDVHYSDDVTMPTHPGRRLGDQWIALNRWYIWTEYGWELGGHLTASTIRWLHHTFHHEQGDP